MSQLISDSQIAGRFQVLLLFHLQCFPWQNMFGGFAGHTSPTLSQLVVAPFPFPPKSHPSSVQRIWYTLFHSDVNPIGLALCLVEIMNLVKIMKLGKNYEIWTTFWNFKWSISMFNISELLNNCSRWSHIYTVCTWHFRTWEVLLMQCSPNHQHLLHLYFNCSET